MTTESGLKLRTKLESAKTLTFTNAATNATYSAGDMIVLGDTPGVVVESVGTSGQAASDTYPNGPDGVLLYDAEKIVLPKLAGAGESFSAGDRLYYNTSEGKVTAVSTSNILCGRALEDVGTSDTEVLADLIVLT